MYSLLPGVMALYLEPVGGCGEGLTILGPSDSGMGDGMDGADELHLVARLGVDEDLLHLYLRLEQHPQVNVLKKI